MTSTGIPVNPSSLTWYMNDIGLSPDSLAKKAGISVSHLDKILHGNNDPGVSFRQLNNIASKLLTTTASLLIPPPRNPSLPEHVDFRRNKNEPLSYESNKQLKQFLKARDNYLSLNNHEDSSSALLRQFHHRELSQRAAETRALLFGNKIKLSLTELSDAVERYGILIFRVHGVPTSDFRGYSAYFDVAPIIVINNKDSENGRKFTLLHELAHLMNHTSGLCSISTNTEPMCNQFAALVLMPESSVMGCKEDNVDAWILKISDKLGVSEHAAAIRLNDLGYASRSDVAKAEQRSKDAWARRQKQQKTSDRPVPQWRQTLSHLGRRYTSTVLDALQSGRIDELDASYMLDTRVPSLEKLQTHLGYDEGGY
ncbi:XRE family transcriptional regulator [Bifidobacterium sp. ESL0745]|uniref:XRE family transcriptional regulator n=1 Tax=Bifidobacterium sp. ESL0745 TaxID=2983226 RepID=UPI0023F781C7|nr:XRE family transcriptional regulator [Bifidobacterium sp. ESL0745]MDF7665941.1 XRE family transcriptional regulator [Bifidobacterium sp. ESL0745]